MSQAAKRYPLSVIEACESKLPAMYAAVLKAADAANYNYEAIAVALQIPIGTVRSRLSRARRDMAKIIAAGAPAAPAPAAEQAAS